MMKQTAFGRTAIILSLLFLVLSTAETTLFAQPPGGRGRSHRGENGPPGGMADNPEALGAPGRPNDPSNTDFSPNSEKFPPQNQREPNLKELFDKATATEAIPLRQEGKFITSDRVRVVANYYKGAADKKTVPFILLHGKGGKKEDFAPLAAALAEKGYAVLVPDLRGHGESIVSWVFDFSAGGERPSIRQKNDYTVESFTDADYSAMRQYDGLLWFQFLKFLHNEGKINLRRLVIVGAGFGGSVGTSWVVNDWQESAKKGRFTKSLILISPENDPAYGQFNEMKFKPGAIGSMIFVGGLEKERLGEAEKIQLEIGREKASVPPEERNTKLVTVKTEIQGTELLNVSSFKVAERIIEFIGERDGENSPSEKWTPIK